MNKRIVSLAVAVLLLLGCIASAEVRTLPAHVEGAIFGGRGDDSIPVELRFDTAWLTAGDNTAYNGDLAAFSALVCADTYFRKKDLERGTPNRVIPDGDDPEAYDWTNLLKELGFTDVEYIESFKVKAYDRDENDSVTMLLGYTCADGCDVFVVAFRGTFSAQEWISAFDPGSPDENYRALTGEHPEWIEAGRFKGADVGAQRAMEFIDGFIAEHDVPENEDRILVTGHSRGGLLANFVGATLEKRGARSFTYAFNIYPATTDPEAPDYATIFNIFDSGDFYCDLMPFGGERFYRYGRDLPVDIAADDAVRADIAELKGRDDYTSVPAEARAEYRELFGSHFESRAALYEMKALVESFDTEEEAIARRSDCSALIGADGGLGLEAFCRAGEVSQSDDGRYTFTLEACDAALLLGYGKMLAYGNAACDAFKSLFKVDDTACRIADLLMENAAGINSGHLLCNDYIMTRYAG